MDQKRRSFLRRAVSVLLAPLGVGFGVVVSKPSVEDRLLESLMKFANGLEEKQGVVCLTDIRGRKWKAWKRSKVYDGYVVDKRGRKWAKWRPGTETYLRRIV